MGNERDTQNNEGASVFSELHPWDKAIFTGAMGFLIGGIIASVSKTRMLEGCAGMAICTGSAAALGGLLPFLAKLLRNNRDVNRNE